MFEFKSMTTIEILAQIVALGALTFIVLSYQKNSHKSIMTFQAVAGVLFAVQFVMLGAYTGALLNIVGAARSLVYSNRDKKWGNCAVWPFVFVLAFIISGIVTWENIYSLYAALAMVIATITLWIKNPKLNRMLTFPCSILWILYNLANGAYSCILSEIFVMSSIVVGVIRYDIKGKQNAPAKE